MVGLDDFDRILSHLHFQGILFSEPPKLVSPGVLQAKFGTLKGSGNIQVYPNATGRSGGNARLNCGSTSQVHTLRTALLKLQWFWDDGPACITPLDSMGKLTQLADGRILLPLCPQPGRLLISSYCFKMLRSVLGLLVRLHCWIM